MEEKKDMQEEIQEQLDLDTMRKIITDNESIFTISGVKYRVSGLTFEQRKAVHERKSERYLELLKNPRYALEDDLKKLYKSRGTDLEQLRKKTLELTREMENVQLKLAEALKTNSNEGDLVRYKDQILAIQEEIQETTGTRTKLLEYCIENQVMIDAFSYIIYLVTEKFEGDKFVPAWSTYDEFQRVKESLVNKIAIRVSLIANPSLEL